MSGDRTNEARIAQVLALSCACSVGALIGCSSDDERADAISTGSTCPNGVCAGGAGGGGSGGSGGSDGSTYTGPTGTAQGTIFAMEPPEFEPFMGTSTESLANPAKVSVYAYGTQYSADYTQASGFRLEDVPVGTFHVLVEDVDDGNGILPSMIGAKIKDGTDATWNIPVTTRVSLETIYGAQNPVLALDETKAHIIATFSACEFQGGLPLPAVKVVAPSSAAGVIYNTPTGWVLDAPEGTAGDGMAIIANIPVSDDYPGALITLTWTVGSSTYETLEFRITNGAVSRVYAAAQC